MSGRHDPDRLLALELKPGALASARGAIRTIETAEPGSPTLIAADGSKRVLIRRAA